MVVHVLAGHPTNDKRQAAPLIGLCGKPVSSLYVRAGARSSKAICPECEALIVKSDAGPPKHSQGMHEGVPASKRPDDEQSGGFRG
jgi:hypothetical protein